MSRKLGPVSDSDLDDHGHNFYTPENMEGVWACHTCGGAEGSIPTWCPGSMMTAFQQDEVYAGRLDFNKGPMSREPHWWTKS